MQKKLIGQGLKYLEEGQFEEATQILSVLVQNYPDCADGHHLLGVIALELGNLEEAYLFTHTALSLNPDSAIFNTSMGNIQLHRHHFADATTAFLRAVESDPGKIEYRYNLANFYLARGEYELAIAAFQSILRDYPDHYLSIRNITICYLFDGQYDTALECAHMWSSEYNVHHEPFYVLGLCYYANQQYTEALASFDTALEIFPNGYEVVTAIAAAYIGLGNNKIAENYLHRSLSIEPNNPAALYLLTCIKHADGEHLTAQNMFLNAIRLDVEYPIVSQNNLETAILHCTTTQRQDPVFFLKCSGADYLAMLSSDL